MLITLQRTRPGRTGSSRLIQLEAAAPRVRLGAAMVVAPVPGPGSEEQLKLEIQRCRQEISQLKDANKELMVCASRGERAIKEAEKMQQAAQVPAAVLEEKLVLTKQQQLQIADLQRAAAKREADAHDLRVRLQVAEQNTLAAQALLKQEQDKTAYLSRSTSEIQALVERERVEHVQALELHVAQLRAQHARELQVKAHEYSQFQDTVKAHTAAVEQELRQRVAYPRPKCVLLIEYFDLLKHLIPCSLPATSAGWRAAAAAAAAAYREQ